MKIDIKTKNLELTESLKSFTEEKIGSLRKFVDILKDDVPEKGKTLAEISVIVERETRHHKKGEVFLTKAEIILPGKKIMAQASGDNLLSTIVEVKDRLQQEIKKYKTKNVEAPRREQKKSDKKF